MDAKNTHLIGSVEERPEWSARYGVRECWLVHHLEVRIEVIAFDTGLIVSRMFKRDDLVRSVVRPDLAVTPGAILTS